MRRTTLSALALVVSSLGATSFTNLADVVVPNDNRVPAGKLANGVLTVRLEARTATWRPEGSKGPIISTSAFAVQGQRLQIPGPLLRVPAGTEIRATVRNSLLQPMWLYGMGNARGIRDSVAIPAGATKEISFRVNEPRSSTRPAR